MAEIEFTIPTVQYGNIKVRGTWDEIRRLNGDDLYAEYNRLHEGRPPKDVTGQYQESPEQEPGSAQPATNEEQAKTMLEEGLGPVTEVPWEGEPPKKSEPWKNGSAVKPAKIEW